MNQYSYLSFSTIIIFKKMLEFILKFLLYPYREREREINITCSHALVKICLRTKLFNAEIL